MLPLVVFLPSSEKGFEVREEHGSSPTATCIQAAGPVPWAGVGAEEGAGITSGCSAV